MIILPCIPWKTWLAALSYHLLGRPRFEQGWRWRLYEPLWLLAAADAFAFEQASFDHARRQNSLLWRWYYRVFTPAALREWRETCAEIRRLEAAWPVKGRKDSHGRTGN